MKLSRNDNNKNKKIKILIINLISIFIIIGSVFIINSYMKSKEDNQPSNELVEGENINKDGSEVSDDIDEQNNSSEIVEEPEVTFTNIRIAAAGDIMFHSPQLTSAYNEANDTYDFRPMFSEVKPILSEADLTIANFETTISGNKPYTGYPMFNSPDEVIDAIKDAGVDVLTTANNHSLDTGSKGLKRTVEVIEKKGISTFGTYSEEPDSRVLIKDVDGVKIALISYTESTNGLGEAYKPETLRKMINLMEEEYIINDIKEAKEIGADFIIAYMHWGAEYMTEPNEKQVRFAELMANEGVDLILGSHPHVIQKSDLIEANGKQTYVIYSMGNFISNQRVETLGDNFAKTEDGIIINFDISKNNLTNETVIENVEYVPTWVYRNKDRGKSKYSYKILPIESFLLENEISASYKKRMERSFEETASKMIENPFSKN